MTSTRRRLREILVCSSLALGAVACSGSDSGGNATGGTGGGPGMAGAAGTGGTGGTGGMCPLQSGMCPSTGGSGGGAGMATGGMAGMTATGGMAGMTATGGMGGMMATGGAGGMGGMSGSAGMGGMGGNGSAVPWCGPSPECTLTMPCTDPNEVCNILDCQCVAADSDPLADFIDSVSSNSPTLTPGHIDMRHFFAAIVALNVAQIAQLNAFLQCGTSSGNMRVVCPMNPQPLVAGDLAVGMSYMEQPIPQMGTQHSLIYSFITDSDGLVPNNWVFVPPFDWDLFRGTDLWLQLIYNHVLLQWSLSVTQVSNTQMTSDVPSSAKVLLYGDKVYFILNGSELPAMPRRGNFSSFAHVNFNPANRGADVSGANPETLNVMF